MSSKRRPRPTRTPSKTESPRSSKSHSLMELGARGTRVQVSSSWFFRFIFFSILSNNLACFLPTSKRGETDLHNPKYTHYGQTIQLNHPGAGINDGSLDGSEDGYSSYSATYTLTLYPNEAFFQIYETTNPTSVMVGTVLIILFTSCLFWLYDCFVQEEFHQNHVLFQIKRQYVRFVTHEVRTPLNAVSMGLQLLQQELQDQIKVASNRRFGTDCRQGIHHSIE